MKNFKLKMFLRLMMLAMTLALIMYLGRHGDRIEFFSALLGGGVNEKAEQSISPSSFPLVTLQSTALPNPPFLVDWCEGERCEERVSKSVVCDSNIYDQADVSTKVVGKISSGEVLADRTLFTKILKVGSFKVDANHRGALVTYAGGVDWATFSNGKWTAIGWETGKERKAAQLDLPKTEPWALIRTAGGITGFVLFFEGFDHVQCPLGNVDVSLFEDEP